ncbi:unnamed protein product, partial [Brassica rapa]
DQVKAKPQKKQVHETSEDDTQSSKYLFHLYIFTTSSFLWPFYMLALFYSIYVNYKTLWFLSSPQADDSKPRKVGAFPNYRFSFKCDQRAEKRREVCVSIHLIVLSSETCFKLEEKSHAKEEEINNMQAKSKVVFLNPLLFHSVLHLLFYIPNTLGTFAGNTTNELRKLRKSLNFKATPMPSFYQ